MYRNLDIDETKESEASSMKWQETYTVNTYKWSSYLVVLKISLIVSARYSGKRNK